MSQDQVIRFIRDHGVVLESARGEKPSLAEHIAGGSIRGSWWSDPKRHEIFQAREKVRKSRIVLVCTLARGHITYIHRRLWPHFIRLANRFPKHALDQVREVHLPSGRHKREDVAFPTWVPTSLLEHSKAVSEVEATNEIKTWLDRYGGA